MAGRAWRSVACAAYREWVRFEFNVCGHINELGSLLRAVAAGHGTTVLPGCAVMHALEHERLQSRRIRGVRLERQLLLCRARALPLSDATLVIGQLLEEVLAQLLQDGRWASAKAHPIDWAGFSVS